MKTIPKVKFDPTARVYGHLIFEEPIGIEPNAKINRSEIGAFSFIGQGTEIFNTTIGRYCSVGPGCRIGPGNHPTDRLTSSSISYSDYFDFYSDNKSIIDDHDPYKSVDVGHDVWIGASSIIANGVSIGNGAIIAAGSVVSKDVPAFAIVGGVPAKLIRQRFDDRKVDRLAQLQWWKYDLPAWGRRGDFPSLSVLTNETLDLLEEIVEERTPPLISGKRFSVTFNGNTPIIQTLDS